MIRTNVKLQVTPEQSAKIQQICFDHGIYWSDTSSDVIYTDSKYLFIHNNCITRTTGPKNFFDEHEFKEIDPELFIATNGTCDTTHTLKELDTDLMESTHTESHSIPTTDQFAKYGFQIPDFQCKLYDKLDDYILGAYFNPNKQKWAMCRWGFDGRNKQGSPNYALTPILVHKPWYETCKFPILINFLGPGKTAPVAVHYYKDRYVYDFGYNEYHVDSWTPLTDTEIEELKRGF